MPTFEETLNEDQQWKTKVLLFGGVMGALTGVLGAYLLIQNAEKQNRTPELTAGEGVRLGVIVLGLLRQVAQLGKLE